MNAPNTSSAEPVLSINAAHKSFAGKPAVRGVSFSVGRGEIVGFLGPNGAGKTTTLRMALGLIRPDSGEIKLFGEPPGPAAFGRIGFLPEERGLYRKIKACDAIIHVARLNGMDRRSAVKKADELLVRYGLGAVRRKKIKTLSKGMAQKVQLLAAIAHDPKFLILDEPFSGLDPVNQKLLEDMVRDSAERGRTVIFSTHVMEHAERLCDKIILMSNGEKIFDGTLAAALAAAPVSLRIGSQSPKLGALIEDVAAEQTREDSGAVQITLKPGLAPRDVLAQCHGSGILLDQFETTPPRLHDAFVTIVGGHNDAGKRAA